MLKRKIIIIPCLANCLELYDFTLFPILLPILAPILFPSDFGLEIGYLAFAISFLIVPFSAIFWGYYGDKYGKDRLLKYSLFIMALPSLVIAFAPTYQAIGIWAVVIVSMARVAQGISASAEVLGSKIYAINSLDAKYHILASCFISAFGALGVSCAVMMGYFAAKEESLWRYAFMIGALIFVLMMFIKSSKKSEKIAAKKNITIASIWNVVMENKEQATYTFALSAILGLLSYTLHSFMISYAIEKLGDTAAGYIMLAKALLCTIVSASVSALLSLYIKINMKLVIRCLLFFLAFSAPVFFYLLLDASNIMFVCCTLSVLLGIYAGLSGVIVIRSFHLESRFRGALLVNAFGVALFGGTAPFILKILTNYSIMYAGLYLASVFFIAFIISLKYDSSPLH